VFSLLDDESDRINFTNDELYAVSNFLLGKKAEANNTWSEFLFVDLESINSFYKKITGESLFPDEEIERHKNRFNFDESDN
jgi:hypothetical protein